MQTTKNQPNIVVLGGGTGSFTILNGIKRYTSNVTALVNVSDDGGSSGLLRDELGVLPPGDVRQCLVALSETEKVRDLFTYQFEDGLLSGHSFGNLFLSAVEKMTESFEDAIQVASDVLRISGKVIPITLDSVKPKAVLPNGQVTEGQDAISSLRTGTERPEISLDKKALISDSAKKAIKEADVIVIAPGNLYGTIAPMLLVDGVSEELKKTKAKVVQVTNLVTKQDQTVGFLVGDFVMEVERLMGEQGVVDFVVFNTDEPTKKMHERYVKDGEHMLEFDLNRLHHSDFRAIGAPLVDKSPLHQNSNGKSAANRTFIRHDADAISREIMKIYFS